MKLAFRCNFGRAQPRSDFFGDLLLPLVVSTVCNLPLRPPAHLNCAYPPLFLFSKGTNFVVRARTHTHSRRRSAPPKQGEKQSHTSPSTPTSTTLLSLGIVQFFPAPWRMLRLDSFCEAESAGNSGGNKAEAAKNTFFTQPGRGAYIV